MGAPPVTHSCRAVARRVTYSRRDGPAAASSTMKPPPRPRLSPARFVTAPATVAEPGRAGAAWSAREKRALLAALRAQVALESPDLRLLRERLPRRSEAEILWFVSRLRGRAAREAVRTQYRHCLEQQRRRRHQLPAPIEVWLELSQTLAEGLEEATATAFSQVLTVAATEPLTLLHSIPPHPTASPDPGGAAPRNPTPPLPQDPPTDTPGGFSVNFQRIYEYLGRLGRGGQGPALPPAEAAVLLALLGSLPQELQALDRAALDAHLRGVYSALTAPQPLKTTPPDDTIPRPPNTEPQPPKTAPPDGWKGVGLCPLNLFLLPLRLLARMGPSGE